MDGDDPGDIEIAVVRVDGHVVVTVAGDLDIATERELANRLAQVDDHLAMVIDLSRVGYVDSAGLHVLLVHGSQRAANGSSLAVRQPSPAVRRILEITGLTALIESEV